MISSNKVVTKKAIKASEATLPASGVITTTVWCWLLISAVIGAALSNDYYDNSWFLHTTNALVVQPAITRKKSFNLLDSSLVLLRLSPPQHEDDDNAQKVGAVVEGGAATVPLAASTSQQLSTQHRRYTLGNKPLDYDHDIQKIIDVSRPYYKLENEHLVHTPPAVEDSCNNILQKNGFICTVKPEMPTGREAGPISAAEAGRHMAIAGSVAAALNQPEGLGKHYYLALDNEVRTSLLPTEEDLVSYFDDDIEKHCSKDDLIMIYAVCIEMAKRSATSQVIMKFPETLGGDVWYLRTSYSVIPAKIFKRRNKIVVAQDQAKEKKEKEDQAVVTVDNSPYAQFEDPHSTPGSIKIMPTNDEDHAMTPTLSLKSGISKVPAGNCLGHFEDCPALPIAFMAAYMLDLGAKGIEILSGHNIPFKKRSSLTGLSTVTTFNHPRDAAFVLHPTPEKQIDHIEKKLLRPHHRIGPFEGAAIKLVHLKIEALKLVYAETHGLEIFCDVEHLGDTMYGVELKTVSSNDMNEIVSVASMRFQLHKGHI